MAGTIQCLPCYESMVEIVTMVGAQLAHKDAGVTGVYNQEIYLEPRREMMQWYADYLEDVN